MNGPIRQEKILSRHHSPSALGALKPPQNKSLVGETSYVSHRTRGGEGYEEHMAYGSERSGGVEGRRRTPSS